MRRLFCGHNINSECAARCQDFQLRDILADSCAQVRIRCASDICKDYDLCVPCFSEGKSTRDHDPPTHPFQVIEQHSVPIFTDDWGADEETLLLEGAETYGLGSWADIADHIGGFRNKDEVRDHYINTYINSSKFPLPEHCSPADKQLTDEWPREKFQARKKRRIEDRKEEAKNAPPQPPKQKPTSSVPSCHEVQGFMPGRLEFENEFVNEAEEAVQHMTFDPFDGDINPKTGELEPEMKLKMTISKIYNDRLTQRVERKKLIFEHQLLDFKKIQAIEKKKSKEERDLVNRAKPFARVMSKTDFDDFTADLEYEHNLRQAIGQLQDWRRMAIGDLEAGKSYEQEKAQRMAKIAQLGQFNLYAGARSKPPPPLEGQHAASALTAPDLALRPVGELPTPPPSTTSSINGTSSNKTQTNSLSNGVPHGQNNMFLSHRPKFNITPLGNASAWKLNSDNAPDFDLLTEDEKDVCCNLRVMPRQYIAMKDSLLREAQKQGGVIKRKMAKEICKMDAAKSGKLFDFFVHSGWVGKAQDLGQEAVYLHDQRHCTISCTPCSAVECAEYNGLEWAMVVSPASCQVTRCPKRSRLLWDAVSPAALPPFVTGNAPALSTIPPLGTTMATSYASPTRQSDARRRAPVDIHLSSSRRPSTPTSASSANIGRRADSPSRIPRYDLGAGHSRKRSRADSGANLHYRTPSSAASVAYSHYNSAPSPLPLANRDYRLSGGLDTPTASVATHLEQQYDSADTDSRRRWTSAAGYRQERTAQGIPTLGGLARERNGHKRTHSSMDTTGSAPGSTPESWRGYVLRVAGGVAGKMWEFSTSAFTGFTAGGGTPYAMTDTTPQALATPSRRDPWIRIERPRDSPVPGAFPADDDEGNGITHSQNSPHGPPPAKRLQTRQGSEWVMVNHEQITTPNRPPQRPSSRASLGRPQRLSTPRVPSGTRGRATRTPSSANRYPNLASAPQHPTDSLDADSTDRRASFASPRSPQHPAARRNTAGAAENATPHQHHTPRHSTSHTPQDDIQRWSAKKAREERQADASMRKLNQQLKAMIREGKAALATKFEVRDDDDASSSYYDEDDGDARMGELEDEGFSEVDFERERASHVKPGW
ncbi:hypothetical protein FH972_023730 [Carpinus fangiana]|uniref:Transcriptional adapter n=1 Tax=Carpinus fangiana TaxID=176857 RepID=A0A5N6KW13_9ROSI|nr:hypothetical protein FH972_023730 [Carpinus fangiana]